MQVSEDDVRDVGGHGGFVWGVVVRVRGGEVLWGEESGLSEGWCWVRDGHCGVSEGERRVYIFYGVR